MLSSLFSAYPSFLVFLGFIGAGALTMALMPAWIRLLTRTHIGQQVRADGPQSHLVKQGTPTMGGVIMLIAIVITVPLVVTPSWSFVAALLATLCTAALGLFDDAEKVIVALRARFPEIVGPRRDDICYATQNRQDAVKALAKSTELVLVIGSRNSSNSNRLREVAELNDTRAFLVDNAGQVDPGWLKGVQSVGLTAGASAPEILVQDVVQKLVQKHAGQVSQLQGTEENITFALPKELQ